MQHKDKYLDEAVKQKNNRYAERCNAAGLNFMACAFETTGAIGLKVTPLMDVTLRNVSKGKNLPTPVVCLASSAELSDITFKVAKDRIYQRLSFVLQKWNAHSIAMKLNAVI
jgi:hypothetical protein